MKFPDFLYIPTPKGVSAGLVPLRLLTQRETATAAATINVGIPAGSVTNFENVIVISGFAVFAQGGGAQTVVDVQVRVVDAAITFVADVARKVLQTASQVELDRSDLELVLLPTEFLQVSVLFSAGVAVNTVRFCAHGYLFNRGNVQFGA